MKIAASIIAALVAGFVVFFLWAAGGIQSPTTEASPAIMIEGAADGTNTSTIVVVTWNIGWAYGMGSSSESLKPKAFMDAAIADLGAKAKALDPDILLIQEIDFDADRSYNVDQAELIAKAAGLKYVSKGISWRANYLPFPYWPPSGHWGAIVSGGAILSKHPLSDCKTELLEKPDGAPWWYKPFYLFRYLQTCNATIGGKTVPLFNTHLDAFYTDNRTDQAERIAEVIGASATGLEIFGGDFNTVQPEATLKSGYEDEAESDHGSDRTTEIIRGIPSLRDVLAPSEFAAKQSEYFTYPADAPNRKLDYIFIGKDLLSVETRIPTEVGDVSDHLPVLSRIVLP